MLFKHFLFWDNIYFDYDLKICEDIFFTIKVISQTEAYTVRDLLFNYFYRNLFVNNSIYSTELYKNDIKT